MLIAALSGDPVASTGDGARGVAPRNRGAAPSIVGPVLFLPTGLGALGPRGPCDATPLGPLRVGVLRYVETLSSEPLTP